MTEENGVVGQVSQEQQAGGTNSFMDFVPQDYAGKEWVSNLAKAENPVSELFKQFDNQLSLIGRKAEGIKVPGEGAAPEDWNNFYKAIGVPDSPDGYQYQAPQSVPDNLKPYYQQDENLLATMKAAALKAGVRPEGFKVIAEAFDQYHLSELGKAVDSTNQLLGQLENNFKQKFGERSNVVLDGWKNSFASLGKEQTQVIESLDPRVKVVLAEQYDAFARKYISEDKLGLDIPSASNGVMTETDYGKEYGKLFAKVRATQPGSPEHEKANQDLNALRDKGAQLFRK